MSVDISQGRYMNDTHNDVIILLQCFLNILVRYRFEMNFKEKRKNFERNKVTVRT